MADGTYHLRLPNLLLLKQRLMNIFGQSFVPYEIGVDFTSLRTTEVFSAIVIALGNIFLYRLQNLAVAP